MYNFQLKVFALVSRDSILLCRIEDLSLDENLLVNLISLDMQQVLSTFDRKKT